VLRNPADKNLIFAVSERWLLQLKENAVQFCFIIFAVLLGKNRKIEGVA